jgi:hypothetical protein
MTPGPGEPEAGPWQTESLAHFADSLTGPSLNRPRLIAVDGRGGSGKTALAGRLRHLLHPAAVVHSDDVAWNHSRFGWDDLMIGGVLEPLRAGRDVHYRPPAWQREGRDGHIDIDADVSAVIVEGVGVSRRELAPLFDVLVWVQCDYDEALHRGILRDRAELGRDDEEALREWWAWEAEEVPFLRADRPWDRAHVIVGTASTLPHDPDTEVMVARRSVDPVG